MRHFLLLLSALVLVTFSGCTSNSRLQSTAYLRAVIIDGTDKKHLTFAFFSDDDKSLTVSGDDIETAKKNASMLLGKEIFTGYTELAVLGNADAKDELAELLNKWKVPSSCMVAYCSDCDRLAKNFASERLYGSICRGNEQSICPKSDIITVLGELLGTKKTAPAAEITPEAAVGTFYLE